MHEIVFLYVTAPNHAVATMIANALVGANLAACVNIIPGVTSIYRWEGRCERADEVVMIIKTTSQNAKGARELCLKHHPHETPAIVAVRIDENMSSKAFCAWIRANSGGLERLC